MRHGWAAFFVVAAVGCTTDGVGLEQRGVLFQATRGVALQDNGAVGIAGMFGTTCEFQTRSGGLSVDRDFPTDTEAIEDARGGMALVRTDLGVHTIRGGETAPAELDVTGVLHARLHDGGVVLLRKGAQCTVEWHGGDGVRTEAVDAAFCHADNGFTADPETGVAVVAAPDRLVVARPGQVDVVTSPGGLVSWGRALAGFVGAEAYGTRVDAFDEGGTPLWSVDVGAPIRSIATLGETDAVAVMVETPTGGEILVLDLGDGHDRGAIATPEPADLVVSPSGTVLGIIRPQQVLFYDVSVGRTFRLHAAGEDGGTPQPFTD